MSKPADKPTLVVQFDPLTKQVILTGNVMLDKSLSVNMLAEAIHLAVAYEAPKAPAIVKPGAVAPSPFELTMH